MNRIENIFSNGKAFIPFITAGDPSIEVTERLVHELANVGVDMIELGIPFSDPMAEGVVIQAADNRALSSGTTTDKIFDMVRRIRRTCDVPLAFMTYVNPVFSYGSERFLSRCKEVGVDAIIVPDLPYEERDEIKPYCREHGITYISMIAPSSKERIGSIASDAEGFIYCVSSLGVTGVRDDIGNASADMIKNVKLVKDIPCAIGFGISTPEQARAMAKISDGVIVGSAIVRIIGQYGKECIEPVMDYVGTMLAAIKEEYR
jgi:tryptophan synthase alpha chain